MNDYMKMLGLKVKDKVTGLTGVVTTVSFDLYGCVQMVVMPSRDKDGKAVDGSWCDYKRLEVLDPKPVMPVPNFAATVAGTENGPSAKPRAPTHTRA